MTTEIVNKNPKSIVLEDLHVKELRKRKYLAKYIDDFSLRSIRDQLEYKAVPLGINIIIANRWFPSTKRCSNCGELHDVGKSEIFICPHCGFTIDRDLNAAINLKNLAT